VNKATLHLPGVRAPSRAPLALALTAALGVAVLPGLAQATTYLVATSGDAGDGSCDATCTLRDAVLAANANPGADTITFASTLSGDTILLDIAGKGNIKITDSLTIQGPGANLLTVSGGNATSSDSGGLVHVTTNSLTVSISGITLANGHTTGVGGALAAALGTVNLSGVAIQNSYAQMFGGGFDLPNGGAVNITHSTISGNSAGSSGGGFVTNYATVSLVDSTVTGNYAAAGGGGFYVRGALTVNNSTISGNSANGFGRGFWLAKFDGTLTNSIVANNANGGGDEFDATGQLGVPNNVTANNTLIEGSYSVSGTFSGANNILGQDPKLGPLTNNGGPTQTLALLPGSPAIDAGNNGTCETTDQRGVARPYDGDKNGSAICDMGAFEVGYDDLDTIFANGFD
jgi:CSLREA domain-containing protein